MKSQRSIGKIIFVNFMKTLGALFLLGGIGVLSYYLTMLYYKQTDKVERSTTYTHIIDINTGAESANLIYCYDTKGKIKAMVLELFDTGTKNMTYVTIPENTQVTMSQTTYAELLQVNQALPQTIMLRDIGDYFSGNGTADDVKYEYGIKILKDDLKADIGYFTALTEKEFLTYYEKGKKKKGCICPTDGFFSVLKKTRSKSAMDDLFEDMWDKQISDITLQAKKGYSEAMSQTDWDKVRLYRVYGKNDGKGFVINHKKNKKLISSIWESEAYTTAQIKIGDGSGADSSVSNNIEILNGSAIDGLASNYQTTMQSDGLSVVNIGNFSGMKQTHTTIRYKGKKKKKFAKKLRKYFPKPKKIRLEKASDLDDTVDIQVILGTDAAG